MAAMEQPLAELYEQCIHARGLHVACDKFFRLLRPTLERIAFRVALQFGARQEAEDVIQEVSLKLIQKDPAILADLPKDPSSSLAYFSVLAANAARDFFRSRNAVKRGVNRTVSIESTLDSILPGGSDHPDRGLLLAQIEECLPEDRKMQFIFRLYYRQGFSAKEISAIPAVELSVKGVESIIHRTVVHIRQKLLAEDVSTGSGKTAPRPS
jgi:RNA polymerase sigma-70 factor (ECF subfamily)